MILNRKFWGSEKTKHVVYAKNYEPKQKIWESEIFRKANNNESEFKFADPNWKFCGSEKIRHVAESKNCGAEPDPKDPKHTEKQKN